MKRTLVVQRFEDIMCILMHKFVQKSVEKIKDKDNPFNAQDL